MKIAFIIPSLVNQGPIIVVHTIVKCLIDKVEQIDVYYFDDKKGLDFCCPTYRIGMDVPIDFDQYDIIHSHMYRPDKYVNKWRKRINKAKTISTIHQDIFSNLKYRYNFFVAIVFEFIWKNFLKKMNAVVVISKKIYSLYEKQIKQLVIIYNGVDITLDNQDIDFEIKKNILNLSQRGYKIIGTYATITKTKGIDQLISLIKIRNDIGLVIIGEGVGKKKLIEDVKKNRLMDRVLFFPYIKIPYNYIGNFDVYAMPSRNEGFGLALTEAALAKIPVVCSNIDVFKEIFDVNEVSFFELEDIQSLSDAVDLALTQNSKKTDKAYCKIRNQFSSQIMANNYLNLYKEILDDNCIGCNL